MARQGSGKSIEIASYSDEIFDKIINKSEGNTLSIAQELYKMSLMELNDLNNYFDIIQSDYKFSEYDLLDSCLNHNLSKSLKILNYLQSVNFPEPYILFLLHNEVKKIYSLSNNSKLEVYIPSYRVKIYQNLLSHIDISVLLDLIEYCHEIDKNIKTGSISIGFWHQLEILISCFILNKTVKNFIG